MLYSLKQAVTHISLQGRHFNSLGCCSHLLPSMATHYLHILKATSPKRWVTALICHHEGFGSQWCCKDQRFWKPLCWKAVWDKQRTLISSRSLTGQRNPEVNMQGARATKPANASTYHVPQSKNIYYEELRTCNSTKAAQVKYAGISLIIGRKEKDEVDLSN